MDVLHTLMVALLSIGLVLAFIPRPAKVLTWLSIIAVMISYVIMYQLIGEQVAQDRNSYFAIYHEDNLTRVLKYLASFPFSPKEDILLSLIFAIMPKGLSLGQFGVVFIGGGILLLVLLLLLLVHSRLVSFSSVPLIMLCVFFDRLFLDMMFNATSSTMSSYFFLFGLFGSLVALPVLPFLASFGIHTRMFYMLACTAALSWPVKRANKLLLFFFGISAAVFSLRLLGFVFIDVNQLNAVISGLWSQWGHSYRYLFQITRGIRPGFPLSVSMFVQVFLSVMLPLLFLRFHGFSRLFATVNQEGDRVRIQKKVFGPELLFSFLLLSSGVFLFFFPDVPVFLRIVVIPIILFPLVLNETSLPWLALVKVAVFIAGAGRMGLF